MDAVPSDALFITDFALHSIGVILSRLNQHDVLLQFVRDLFVEGYVNLIHMAPEDIERIVRVMKEFELDFDDAYQYAAAEKLDITIVSFDQDFDKTSMGRKAPAEAIRQL